MGVKWFLPCIVGVLAWLFPCSPAPRADEGAKQDGPSLASSPTNSPWSRIVTIGASATAGMKDRDSVTDTNTALYRISRYLDAALLMPHEPVRNFGDPYFFLAPTPTGRRQIERTLKLEPSMVVGIDFLFWFCYGEVPEEEERLRRFERGLTLLEPLTCPLILGDIPDASAATNKLLRPRQIPQLETIAAANDRLRKWAAARKQTAVVGLADFMQAVRQNRPIQVRNRSWQETSLFLQEDRLHPTPKGAALLALAILDRFFTSESPAGHDQIRWDFESLFREGYRGPER